MKVWGTFKWSERLVGTILMELRHIVRILIAAILPNGIGLRIRNGMTKRACTILGFGIMRLGWVDGLVVILGALASLLLRGVDGLNLYRYVRNNPVNLVDPDGMSPDPPPENLTLDYDITISEAAPPDFPDEYNVVGIKAHQQFAAYMRRISGTSGNWVPENTQFKDKNNKSWQPDLMYYGGKRNPGKRGRIWELKPVSYRKEPKHQLAVDQLQNYVDVANDIKEGGLTWDTGTKDKGPLPFKGTLTLKEKGIDGTYTFKYFIPENETDKGLIYYTAFYEKNPDAPIAIPEPIERPKGDIIEIPEEEPINVPGDELPEAIGEPAPSDSPEPGTEFPFPEIDFPELPEIPAPTPEQQVAIWGTVATVAVVAVMILLIPIGI